MAKCPNKNTVEYKALNDVFKSEITTDNIINTFQEINNSDNFPTIVQANLMLENKKIAFSLKQKNFADSLLSNLRRERIGSTYLNEFYINSSNPQTREFDESILDFNYKRFESYLQINNIPRNRVEAIRTKNSYRVTVNNNLFTENDMLESSRSWDTNRARGVVMHLKRMFPQVDIQMLTPALAEEKFDSLPQWKKNKTKFKDVNSFYVDGVVYLVKGRVTDEIAIEEMLHPFVDAIKIDNEKLFNNLLNEASINFPEMIQEINAAYTADKGFSQQEIDIEIVTQTLARHFNREYENPPTRGLLARVKEVLEWFMSVINDYSKYLTGRPLSVSSIKSTTNFSNIAKLLNTEGIQFKLESRVDGKVRFSLSPRIQKQVDKAINESNDVQKLVINTLMSQAISSKQEIDSLSAGFNNGTLRGSVVTLNEEDHTYHNTTTKTVYTSATTAIKGKLANEEDVKLNLRLGNDVDTLLDSVIAGTEVNDVFDSLTLLDRSKAEMVFDRLQQEYTRMTSHGEVALSQVVFFDEQAKIAGTADVVLVQTDGSLKILDLKTTKNSLSTMIRVDLINPRTGVGYSETIPMYDKKFPLGEDSKLREKTAELGEPVTELSTRGQHALQVNLYRRMAENMGYEVSMDLYAVSTLHFNSGIEGIKKDQEFNGDVTYDSIVPHAVSENLDLVEIIIPLKLDNQKTVAFRNAIKNKENAKFRGKEQTSDQTTTENPNIKQPEEGGLVTRNILEKYVLATMDKKAALEMVKKSIFTRFGKDKEISNTVDIIAYLGFTLKEGGASQALALSTVMRDALKQITAFNEYLVNPENFDKKEFITYVLEFDRFIATFRGLHEIEDLSELNASQRQLILNIKSELTKATGSSKNEIGLVDKALYDYMREFVKNNSNNEYGVEGSAFSKEDLEDILVYARDINVVEYGTRDVDTDPDVLLSLMGKVLKAKKFQVVDNVKRRNEMILKFAQKLYKLSPESNREKLYNFALILDEKGEFTGRYVQQLGQRYSDIAHRLNEATKDENGKPMYYRDVFYVKGDLTPKTAKQKEDMEYNRKLAKAKKALTDFYTAERKNEDNQRVDGEYHRYTTEFIANRKRYEEYIPGSKRTPYGRWVRKRTDNNREYSAWEAKYFDQIEYTQIKRDGENNATGEIYEKKAPLRVPKVIYREALLDTKPLEGPSVNMRSEKYIAIMNPTDALGVAQKEFYEMFIDTFERDLLKKLAPGVMAQMLGRAPVVQSNLIDQFKDKPNVLAKIYSKLATSLDNFTTTTSMQKGIIVDENENFTNSLPVFYTGNVRQEEDLVKLDKQISALKEKRKKGGIKKREYDKELAELNGKYQRLRNTPLASEVSKDLATSLMKFSAMAENFEVMGEAEDTLRALVKVIEQREYGPSQTSIELGKNKDGMFKRKGRKKEDGAESFLARRANKYMEMVFYENELISKGMFDKLADGLIQLSSLSYVAFNPFGNFNNYAIGRINNNIESIGGRFYSQKSYARATYEYNKRALPDLLTRTGYMVGEVADIATFGSAGFGKSDYDPQKPNSLYEAYVDDLNMMDSMTDLREQGNDLEEGESWFSKATRFGYILQDAAEYNVQTKVGMAVLMDTMLKSSIDGTTLSYYDAHDFDAVTHKAVRKKGFDLIVKKDGTTKALTNEFRYEIRGVIREVNKQIHGNYAKEDRMVMQQSTIGNLAAQFHKWVAPAIRARYQREYFDQNLGWMEGRYISALKFVGYIKEQVVKGNLDYKSYKTGFLEDSGADGKGGNRDQRAQNKLDGFYRTMGEAGIMLSVFFLGEILAGLLAGDDDDSDLVKRFKNITRYQVDRVGKELVMFVPVLGTAQQYQMVKSPIASTRTLGELGEAMYLSLSTPAGYILRNSDEEFYSDSDYVYQRGVNKGKLKVGKNWADALPIIYTINKWNAYLQMNDFFRGK